jgi:hypothetical protein
MKESTFFQRYKEIILGVLMLALAAFYLYHSTFIRTRSMVSVSAKMIPEILGCLVVVLGVFQVLNGIRALAAVKNKDAATGARPVFISSLELRDAIPVLKTFVIILLYAISYEWLGFIISSTLCMFLQMWVLTPKSKFRPGAFFGISLVVAIVVFIAFRQGLSLSLPPGLFEDLPVRIPYLS